MQKTKVFLQYPWKSADSTYYKNILDYPPKDIIFLNNYGRTSLKREVIGSSKKFESTRKFKNFLRRILNVLSLPNLVYTPRRGPQVIHCAHCLSLNRKPWVVDTETYDRVSAGGNIAHSKIGKWLIKNRLESNYCKKIIAWSEDCKKTFEEAFPGNKKILSKIELVPFAMPLPSFKKISHKNVRLLFVARWFDAKGGRTTLEVFDRITKKYSNTEAIFICPTPQEYKEKYSSNKKIKILELMPQDKLFNEIYPSSDIFFYPGYGDSYGFALPEAMAFSLPIVTVDSFARREIVKDGKTGFIVSRPKDLTYENCMQEEMLAELVEKTSLLIRNPKLRDKMGKAGREEVKSGLFSIEKRNKHLEKIYCEAIISK